MPIESKIINNNSTNTTSSGSVNTSRHTRAAGISSAPGSGQPISEGQVIRGEVTDIRGKEVTIALSDNTVLTGTMRDISNLYIGQTTAFRVASITPRLITLESLLGDISNQENLAIRKALDEAELPASNRNILLIRELLDNRMSINKETIQDMIRQTSALNDISPSTIVLMNKYGIPTTQALASQFENYQNGNNSLIQDINNLSENIPNLLEELSINADAEPVAQFGSRLMSILSEHIVNNPRPYLTSDLSTFSAPERSELANYINEATAFIGDNSYSKEAITSITAGIANGTASTDQVWNIINRLSLSIGELADSQNTDITSAGYQATTDPKPPQLPDTYNKLSFQNNYIQFNNNSLSGYFNQAERDELCRLLKPLINDNNYLQTVSRGDISVENVFTTINSSISSSYTAASELFSSRVFTKLFKKVINNAWTLSPRDLAQTENIAEHYRQLANELQKTTELINNNLSGITSANLTEQAARMNDNLNFMNELNNYFQYIQLPVKFQDQTAHGDLYVYTKKEELKRHPDKVSVLLHLDFEHLGNLDIYITKDKSRVDTKFNCSDSDTVNLIKTNMEMLKETLAENGYIFSASVCESNPKQDIVKEFLEQTAGSDGKRPATGNLNRYAFDLRA